MNINGKNMAKSVVNQCVTCFRHRPVVVQPIMDNLSNERVEPSRAFLKLAWTLPRSFYDQNRYTVKFSSGKSVRLFIYLFSNTSGTFRTYKWFNHRRLFATFKSIFYCRRRRRKSFTVYSDNAIQFRRRRSSVKTVK